MTRARRRGLSLGEVVLAALVIGVSAIPVLELLRSSTVSLEVNHIDSVARGLAADVLERLAGRPTFTDPLIGRATAHTMGAPPGWDIVLDDDPSLLRGFPRADLARLLDSHEVRLSIKIHAPSEHTTAFALDGMNCAEVTVSWNDRNDRQKEVTFARLVEK